MKHVLKRATLFLLIMLCTHSFAYSQGTVINGDRSIVGSLCVGSAGTPVDRLSLCAAPVASATRALLNLSNTALSGGSAAGTYLGANPAACTGNFWDFQLADAARSKLTCAGALTVISASIGVATGTSFNSITGLANPSASVGLTAVNGSATTVIRSDGAPALSQSIIPTWTGKHDFRSGVYAFRSTTSYVAPTLPDETQTAFVSQGNDVSNVRNHFINQNASGQIVFHFGTATSVLGTVIFKNADSTMSFDMPITVSNTLDSTGYKVSGTTGKDTASTTVCTSGACITSCTMTFSKGLLTTTTC